ncbi:hypothetical protein [Sphingosinicella sp. CPCC 101087]|uniref:hypothetical protein n=1 Tax=Sphingosinicella sp. CPCC 101087 TaxID=2497754 RepID=UPI00101B67A5|nr:hypothetical protein [Sphingosinicella sp. CPCC 101087]
MIRNDEPSDIQTTPPRRRTLIIYVLLAAGFFLLGLAAMGWTLSRWDSGARMLGIVPEPAQAPPTTIEPAPTDPAAEPAGDSPEGDSALPERIVIDPEITRRVAALERRIALVDTQSRAAVGNADRAEGLLVAFAARRALDRGVALGFLEALLRQRFGDTQPQAVGTIITAAREPVTLQELQDELQQVSPQLVGAGPEQSWWDALRAELGSLITVRREDSPSTEPSERLRRATRRLEAGQVDVALAEVLRLPGREHAGDWIAKARRYVAARRALDTVETAALLEPRAARQAVPTPAPAPTPVGPAPGAAEDEPDSAAPATESMP